MDKSVEILGVRIDAVDAREALDIAVRLAQADRPSYIVTPNAEIVVASRSHSDLKHALACAELAVGDGVGVLWASRVLRRPLPEKVNGIDLMLALLKEARARSLRVYLLGASSEVVTLAARRIRTEMGVDVVGFHHGYFSDSEDVDVFRSICAAEPDIIFVGMGSPRQELWMYRHVQILRRGVMMGVGGSFDVISGAKTRAPLKMQQLGLEWLYRLIKEPSRIRRIAALPKFVALVLLSRLREVLEVSTS